MIVSPFVGSSEPVSSGVSGKIRHVVNVGAVWDSSAVTLLSTQWPIPILVLILPPGVPTPVLVLVGLVVTKVVRYSPLQEMFYTLDIRIKFCFSRYGLNSEPGVGQNHHSHKNIYTLN